MLRLFKVALILACFGTASAVLGQPPRPMVEIVLSQPSAHRGDTITADVYVRNAVNIAGTDIGIVTDEQCLKILDRQPGDFLPTTAEESGFSAFSELHDHDTRLAASLLKDGPIANGDGLFFQAQLEVTCDEGVAPVKVVFVELTGVDDPANENTTFTVYKLDTGNVSAVDAQLNVTAGEITAEPSVVAPTTSAPTSTAPTATVAATTVPPTAPVAAQSPALLIVVLLLAGAAVIGVILVVRRRR